MDKVRTAYPTWLSPSSAWCGSEFVLTFVSINRQAELEGRHSQAELGNETLPDSSPVFNRVIEQYFHGKPDMKTLALLGND